MSLGVTTGKFYPFHRGHSLLIEEAKARVERLVAIVGEREGRTPDAEVRAGWIREQHPGVEVIVSPEDIPNAPEPWAERTLDLLGRAPDLVFTSEPYGERWATLMGARHESVDPARARVPTSGSALRRDLGAHWEQLAPPAKAHYARRVRLVGVDSSGKTTLANALAQALQTAWVPEFGRHYWEGRRHLASDAWTGAEFAAIAAGQRDWEEALARQANRVLICDTDPLTTVAWRRRILGDDDPALCARAAARRYALTLVCLPEFGVVQDGTRDPHGPGRERMHRDLVERLKGAPEPVVEIGGDPAQRLTAARAALEPLLAFAPLPEA